MTKAWKQQFVTDRLDERRRLAQKRDADRDRKATQLIPVGTTVRFWRDVGNHKLRAKWFGPAQVVGHDRVAGHVVLFKKKQPVIGFMLTSFR
ncbi:hypothetical protein SARC_07534 [Sphaeroforma arctica JP610]|uniref:Uncharacterized protein n=1 Tax=Sphaeroforma arctica JP610 TaxID=667725 RepID=A0A0L0FU74_9EUKA|nr:hypothetical protein SARC_07534 [Sphaeroforma arctica JP610]KNC80091.1 hypothetical protein SARC_07534 [Sphaeroforma arctica JP610]|eukprot:XP_014153993.1 hypothetical protein SARC_07534 [Sphaeroforma arctica JP610]